MQGSDERRSAEGEPTDISLMLCVQASGNTEAFALLAGRYRPQLRRFFAALLPAGAPADDFAQETLLRLWLSRERYQPSGKFSAYLFQIARHYYLNQRVRYRAQQIQEVSVDPNLAEGGEHLLRQSNGTEPEDILMKRIEHERIRNAVAALPLRYQSVFVLSHFEGLKYAEIARRLKIPVGTVKSRMSEAVRCLRAALPQED